MAIDPAILAKLKASKNKYARGGNTVKFQEGKTKFRLLQKGSEQFWKEIGVHWLKTEKDGKVQAVVGCSDEVFGTPCAVCAAIDKAMACGTDEEKAIMKEWRVKKAVLVHAIMRTGKDASAKPQILEMTGTTWSKISGTIEEYAAEDQDILSPDTGIDLIIERVGKGLNTEYNPMIAPGVSQKVPKEILNELPSFDEYVEKELFKGDERKALTLIANFSGLAVSGLTAVAGPSRTTKMLTDSSVDDAVIEDATPAEIVPDAELAEVAEALAAEPEETEDEREEREIRERATALAAKRAAAKAVVDAAAKTLADKNAAAAKALAAKKAAAAASTVTKADSFVDPSKDDIEALLAELDS